MSTNKNIHAILIKVLGVENASKEKQDELVDSVGAVVYQAVIVRAMEEMADETLDQFEKLTNGEPTPDLIIEFFLKNIPNFEAMMQEEAEKVLGDGINMMKNLEK